MYVAEMFKKISQREQKSYIIKLKKMDPFRKTSNTEWSKGAIELQECLSTG